MNDLDKAALDRWITREPPEYRCEECGALVGECEHTEQRVVGLRAPLDSGERTDREEWGA